VIGLLLGAVLGGIAGIIVFGIVGFVGGLLTYGPDGGVAVAIQAALTGALVGAVYGALYGALRVVLCGPFSGPGGRPAAVGPKSIARRAVIHLACVAAVVGVATYVWWDEAAEPPNASEVRAMTAVLFRPPARITGNTLHVDFTVPDRNIPDILTSMTPASRDWNPGKWQSLGELHVICNDGRRMTIDLYMTLGSRSAFSVNAPDRPWETLFVSNYFRGGSDRAIVDALRRAYLASRRK
jgi:hypothetical protein